MNSPRYLTHLLIVLTTIALIVADAADAGARESSNPTIKKRELKATQVNRPTSGDHAAPGEPRTSAAFSPAQSQVLLAQYNFDGPPGSCTDQGWTSVDLTGNQGLYFHVDDATALNGGGTGKLVPISGNQSLWCGTQQDPNDKCTGCYPGYGNDWYQCFESVTFARSGDVTVQYEICWDSEANYDVTFLQYWDGASWNNIQQYDGTGGPIPESYVIPGASLPPGEVKLRFLFDSDGAWSDEDGLWCTDGAVIIDNLQVSASGSGVIDFQDFETEPAGANVVTNGNWSACNNAFGDFAGLFENPFQEDPCDTKRCVWGFYNNSPDVQCVGGLPAVPYGQPGGPYLENEIWSPQIPLTGTGSKYTLQVCVYKDIPQDPLVFFRWRARSSPDGVCWDEWCSDNFVYWGDSKRWEDMTFDISDCVAPNAQYVQIALGAVDLCEQWCGVLGSGTCHTHAPLLDNVSVYRDEPSCDIVWDVKGPNLFHDRFPDGGIAPGPVRVDRFSGDTALLEVTSAAGLKTISPGRPAVYLNVREIGAVNAAAMEDPAYPFQGYVSGGGYARFLGAPTAIANQFEFDVQDGVFQSGDVVEFYFSAEDVNGCVSYWSEFTGAVATESAVEALPMEMTCMPGPAALFGGGDILYVDNYEGRGSQPFFDTAFQLLTIENQVDRYDARLRGTSTPGADVTSAVAQMIPYYNAIIWSSGSPATGNINDADWNMLIDFLDNHPNGGGIYFSADNLACEWLTQTGPGAVRARAYMNYSILDCCHRDLGLPNSPNAEGHMPLTAYQDNGTPDTWAVIGGCPGWCCFDVLFPGTPAVMEATYQNSPAYGSVLGQKTLNLQFVQSTVKLAGFSLHKMRDAAPNPLPARAIHIGRSLQCLGTLVPIPVAAENPPVVASTALGQNYPNPFNPTTTIEYSLASRARVNIEIFDVAGRRIRTLLDDERPAAARHTVDWDGRDNNGRVVSAGVYFYRLSADEVVQTRKMILVK